ncbi:uncharacterized protein LOC143301208 isoform X2 [Babylonia areolata]
MAKRTGGVSGKRAEKTQAKGKFYEIETDLATPSSRLRLIFGSEEEVRGRYSCTMEFGGTNRSTGCLVTELPQRGNLSRSVLCSEKATGSAKEKLTGMIPPPLPPPPPPSPQQQQQQKQWSFEAKQTSSDVRGSNSQKGEGHSHRHPKDQHHDEEEEEAEESPLALAIGVVTGFVFCFVLLIVLRWILRHGNRCRAKHGSATCTAGPRELEEQLLSACSGQPGCLCRHHRQLSFPAPELEATRCPRPLFTERITITGNYGHHPETETRPSSIREISNVPSGPRAHRTAQQPRSASTTLDASSNCVQFFDITGELYSGWQDDVDDAFHQILFEEETGQGETQRSYLMPEEQERVYPEHQPAQPPPYNEEDPASFHGLPSCLGLVRGFAVVGTVPASPPPSYRSSVDADGVSLASSCCSSTGTDPQPARQGSTHDQAELEMIFHVRNQCGLFATDQSMQTFPAEGYFHTEVQTEDPDRLHSTVHWLTGTSPPDYDNAPDTDNV